MIWIRRLLTIPLGLLFLVLFALTLVVLRVNDTFLEPDFYVAHLEEADIYRFVSDDLLTSAIEELREKEPGDFSDNLDENPLDTLALSTEEIVSSVQTALPPSWIQEQVEEVIWGAGDYLTGELDSFEVTINAAERARTATRELKELVRKAELYDLLFDEIVIPQVDTALEEEGRLPFGVSLTSEEIVDAVQSVAPEEWVKDQVEHALDEVTAYLVGDQEHFEIKVQLSDRADVALAEVKRLLKKANFFELLFDQVVDPLLEEQVADLTQLPFGVAITQEEVRSALRELVPPAWLEEQVLGVIDEAGPYLSGKADSFRAVVHLAGRKEVALTIIEDLARAKLKELAATLPPCPVDSLPIRIPVGELPPCIPPGLPIGLLIEWVHIDVGSAVGEMIGGQIPDQLTYTEADLRRALEGANGQDTLDVLDDLREIIREGWTFTDADLREDLLSSQGEGAVEALDDLRAALSDGWVYSSTDLRQDLLDASGQEALDNLDNFRSGLSLARDFRYLTFVLWGLLLLLIGALGGRRWWSRIAWASAFLALASALIFVASGPGYEATSERLMDEFRAEQLGDLEGTALLAAEKVLDVAEAVADDFLSGIASDSQTLLFTSLIALGASLAWGILFGRRRQEEP